MRRGKVFRQKLSWKILVEIQSEILRRLRVLKIVGFGNPFLRNQFARFIRFEVGLGVEIQFGEDVWCGDSPHKDDFRGLFLIAFDD